MHTRVTHQIVRLDEITPAHEPCAGAKAFNCARLKQAGFRVPDGLVLLSTATENDWRTVSRHPWFDELPEDARFAVRSSGIGEDGAGHSFAGIHETLLDVARQDLEQALAKCLASAHSAQALEYRRAQGLSTGAIRMAVLIQEMVRPIASGVAFTINPVTGAGDEVVINAAWGLGEALVSGQIDPDELVIGKHDGNLRWSRIGDKGQRERSGESSLPPDRARDLTAILHRIERFYGAPQDVEWCYGSAAVAHGTQVEGDAFWIVQSRPITTAGAPRRDETEWTRANIGEVLPDLTSPQVLSVIEEMMNRAERKHIGGLLAPEDSVGPTVKAFHGRLYFNLSQLRHICRMSGTAPAAMLRSIGHPEAIEPSDEQPTSVPVRQRLALVPDFARLVWRHLRVTRVVAEHDRRTREYMQRLTVPDRRDLSDAEIWTVIERWFAEAPDYMQTVLLLSNVLFHEAPVQRICERVGFSFARLVYPHLAIGARSVSAQQAFDLTALARLARREPKVILLLSSGNLHISHVRFALRGTAFLGEFERFLAKYGHRGRYEYDWSLPRYGEDPSPLLLALRAHVAGEAGSDGSSTAARDAQAAEAWAEVHSCLSPWQRWTLAPQVRRALARIKQYYVWREHVRSDIARVLSALRAWHLVLAERFVERGWLRDRDDYFLIEFREIAAVMLGRLGPEKLRGIAAERAAIRARQAGYNMPLLMRASQLPDLMRTTGVAGGVDRDDDLRGQPVSGGCVEAEVVVVRDPGDFSRMTRGAILVAPATDPSWTPLFTLASGVIVEVGGVLSHASTIAREYGLPAIANVTRATRRLRTGDRVRLDANRGVVERIARAR
jgi:phosphohistidine swiveling domain-containing protein